MPLFGLWLVLFRVVSLCMLFFVGGGGGVVDFLSASRFLAQGFVVCYRLSRRGARFSPLQLEGSFERVDCSLPGLITFEG